MSGFIDIKSAAESSESDFLGGAEARAKSNLALEEQPSVNPVGRPKKAAKDKKLQKTITVSQATLDKFSSLRKKGYHIDFSSAVAAGIALLEEVDMQRSEEMFKKLGLKYLP